MMARYTVSLADIFCRVRFTLHQLVVFRLAICVINFSFFVHIGHAADNEHDIRLGVLTDSFKQKNFRFFTIAKNQPLPPELFKQFQKNRTITFHLVGLEDALIEDKAGATFRSYKVWKRSVGDDVITVSYKYLYFWQQLLYEYGSAITKRMTYIVSSIGGLVIELRRRHIITSFDNIKMIGYCFGAHVAGQIGEFVLNQTHNEKIGMILGLDPAGIGFGSYPFKRLRSGNANYVQIIHTSIILGTSYREGDADIIVEGGIAQPNTFKGLNFFASHSRSLDIHYDIITKQYQFKAFKDENINRPLSDYYRNLFDENIVPFDECAVANNETIVGIYNRDRNPGIFHLKTGNLY